MKTLYYSSIFLLIAALHQGCGDMLAESGESQFTPSMKTKTQDFYSLSAVTIEGERISFEQFRGKRLLIVNTASECGYTPQYQQLQELYESYQDSGFVVIGFPANDFGRQEPGTNEEIASFCSKNYGVSFPMMEKVSVIGEGKDAVYQWLTEKEKNGVQDVTVGWNFNKFLVDGSGQWTAYYPSAVSPLDERIINFAQGR